MKKSFIAMALLATPLFVNANPSTKVVAELENDYRCVITNANAGQNIALGASDKEGSTADITVAANTPSVKVALTEVSNTPSLNGFDVNWYSGGSEALTLNTQYPITMEKGIGSVNVSAKVDALLAQIPFGAHQSTATFTVSCH